jgi:hypothetical protein
MTAPAISTATNQTAERELEVIFSLREGYVWASWPTTVLCMRIGPHDVVAAMMEDFLAQDALGERLMREVPKSG